MMLCKMFMQPLQKNARFHVSWKYTHVFPPPTLKSSCQQIKIVLSIDGVYKLVNVIITNPTWIDLVSWGVLSRGVVATIMTQTKDGFYRDQFLMDIFLPLAIEVFEFLHQQEDGFFIDVPTWHGEQKALEIFIY